MEHTLWTMENVKSTNYQNYLWTGNQVFIGSNLPRPDNFDHDKKIAYFYNGCQVRKYIVLVEKKNLKMLKMSQVHGHSASGECLLFPKESSLTTWRGSSAEESLESFYQKRDALLAHPSVNFVEVTWECHFKERKMTDVAMSQFFANKFVHPGMTYYRNLQIQDIWHHENNYRF